MVWGRADSGELGVACSDKSIPTSLPGLLNTRVRKSAALPARRPPGPAPAASAAPAAPSPSRDTGASGFEWVCAFICV